MKAFILAMIVLNVTLSYGQNKGLSPDSLEVSLLTCSPRQQIYSLYGHTAIRLRDVRTGLDVAVNYGVFSFDKPLFVPRFVFGIADYEIGVIPFRYFIIEYRLSGGSVTQQVLNLKPDEKLVLFDAIQVNMLPENKSYRYNFFYDNCTTRARDMITRCIRGGIAYMPDSGDTSYRKIIHGKNEEHRWARFGNDLLLGIGADMSTTQEQRQFLPENLMHDFGKAIRNDNREPLVDTTMVILEGRAQVVEREFLLTPMQCALLLLAITVIVTTIEVIKKKNLRYFDAFLMFFTSIVGTVIFSMIFSQHPTVKVNLQILLFNPLPFFFIRRLLKRQKSNDRDCQYMIWTTLICLFFIGGLFQSYAEGVYVLALSLLIRNIKGVLLYYNKLPFR
ncbi:Lnb N-terminal periplasmic domain-containing protein [Prevotella sp.]|uniref:Lnb N-terminal periplasmic domain-containing protein n=1 Tax=Prevotella sp. TaxID=59823 RepID=UPI002A821387|nr:DUF4105 domain-containing protein [Prevotella sp.]